MNEFDQEVRVRVYRSFQETGRAPDPVYQTRPDVAEALRRLAEARVLVLRPDGLVRMAMPFSDVPTPFSVTWKYGTWWANCAWDALGMGAALDHDVDIESYCANSEQPMHLSVRLRRLQGEGVVHIPLPPAQWWVDIVSAWESILLFRCDDDVHAWCRRRGTAAGQIVPVATVYRLACGWYSGCFEVTWQPPSMSEGQALLQDWGLVGSFWNLSVPV